jgi:hypothetical protein
LIEKKEHSEYQPPSGSDIEFVTCPRDFDAKAAYSKMLDRTQTWSWPSKRVRVSFDPRSADLQRSIRY